MTSSGSTARRGRRPSASARKGEASLAKYASPLRDLRTTATGAYQQALLAVTEELPAPDALVAPVLVLLSEHSTFTDPAATMAFLKRLPDAEIVGLPARHWIPTEQPQAMRSAIESWLQRRFPAGLLPPARLGPRTAIGSPSSISNDG